MARYWVIGGEYADTGFARMASGGAEERYGPFDSRADALTEWQRRAWATVDNAHARYRIEEEGNRRAAKYWVVGCAYTDTSFREPSSPEGEQWYGPFESYEDAKTEWQRRAWASVDDALSRYRIEKLAEKPQK